MIVWVNGPFGVGKSVVAAGLVQRWPEAIVYDPECLGFLLRRWTPSEIPVGDFQDLGVWRTLPRETAIGLVADFHRPLIVPMTMLNPAYFDEIVGGLSRRGVSVHHYCLTAAREVVLARAAERGGTGDWFPTKFDEYEPSLSDPRFGLHIDTTRLSADQVVERILGDLPSPLPTRA